MYLLPADTAAPPPSFDLGIDSSPTHSSEATRSDKIFANDPYTPSSKVSDRSTSALQPSCGVVEVSPTRDSKHLAQCIILDIIHITEEGINPDGKVLYGQLIAGPPDKIVITGTPTQQVSWSPALLHRKIEQPVLDKLLEACLEISEVHTRRSGIFLGHIFY